MEDFGQTYMFLYEKTLYMSPTVGGEHTKATIPTLLSANGSVFAPKWLVYGYKLYFSGYSHNMTTNFALTIISASGI